MRLIDETGRRYGSLLVLSRAESPATDKRALWRCICDCGSGHLAPGYALRAGRTHCGCKRGGNISAAKITHGEGGHGTHRTAEYQTWSRMISRCENPERRDFRYYGARGIRVGTRWRESFPAFVADVGRRPSPAHTIGRIDNDGNYEPGNVRWETRDLQNQNRRSVVMLTFRGETLCVAEWARRAGLRKQTLHARLKRGWPLERALRRDIADARTRNVQVELELA